MAKTIFSRKIKGAPDLQGLKKNGGGRVKNPKMIKGTCIHNPSER